MPEQHDETTHFTERREQPFLYSWNRRLRHLHGISLRNLNIAPPAGRSRGKTITDDDYNLKSPAKILAQDERKTLQHARSFDNLAKAGSNKSPTPLGKAVTTYDASSSRGKRPGARTLRRRSTLHWATSDPKLRQLKLEAVEETRLVDVWFSIHHQTMGEPLYISEVMEKSMNPSFSFFDLSPSVINVYRSDEFDLKVWAKSNFADEYKLLLEMRINLRSLQFIGKSMEHFHHPLPENCVLVHLSDGIYTSFTDLPSEDSSQPALTEVMKTMMPAQPSSFDALMQLANLDDCIQDALVTRGKLEAEMSDLLSSMQKENFTSSEISTQRDTDTSAKSAVLQEAKSAEAMARNVASLHESQMERTNFMQQSILDQNQEEQSSGASESSISKLRKDIEQFVDRTDGQRRRICTTLSQIFPIEPIRNKTLQFTIRGIYLPNSTYDDTNSDEIAAALGYTSRLVYQLSLYLSIPLPYDINIEDANVFIRDRISASLPQRKFPLFPTNVTYKFEYAVFLLNKDIEFLMNRCGVRVLDVRHTLPNLKYLLYLLTSGTGELPARKAGGIRGLIAGRGSPSISRRGSEDSVVSQQDRNSQGLLTRINGAGDENAHEKTVGVREPSLVTHFKGLPYRRSLLRDTG